MLASRQVFADTDFSLVSIHCFTDASPQWEQRELLASSYDLVYRGEDGQRRVERRLFPAISLGGGMRTVHGKTCASLWSTLR